MKFILKSLSKIVDNLTVHLVHPVHLVHLVHPVHCAENSKTQLSLNEASQLVQHTQYVFYKVFI